MKYVFCLFIFLSSLSLHAQSWEKTYICNDFFGVQKTSDNGLIFSQLIGKDYPFFLVKTDVNGKILWRKQFEDSLIIARFKNTVDGGYIVAGMTVKTNPLGNAFVMKLDACGSPVWTTIFASKIDGNAWTTDISEKTNGDIIAIAMAYNTISTDGSGTIVFCLDHNGNLKWKYIKCDYRDIDFNYDGSILLTGNVYKAQPGYPDTNDVYARPTVTKLDSNGKEQWTNIYGITEVSFGIGWVGLSAPDNKFISVSEGDNDTTFIIKYDSSGKREWVKITGDHSINEQLTDGAAINDSTYLLLYSNYTDYNSDQNIRIYKINSNGQILGKKDFNRKDYTKPINMVRTSNGKFIISAICNDSNGSGYGYLLEINENLGIDTFYIHSKYKYDTLCPTQIPAIDTIYFPKRYKAIMVDSNFYTGTESISAPATPGIKIYPNPFTNSTNISYTLQQIENVKIEVIDIMGRNIATLINSRQEPGNHNAIFNAGDYNSANAGIYIVRMTVGACVTNKQIILVK